MRGYLLEKGENGYSLALDWRFDFLREASCWHGGGMPPGFCSGPDVQLDRVAGAMRWTKEPSEAVDVRMTMLRGTGPRQK